MFNITAFFIEKVIMEKYKQIKNIDIQCTINNAFVDACAKGDLTAVKFLLECGANVNTQSSISPIIYASYHKYYKITDYLIDNGSILTSFNPDYKNEFVNQYIKNNMSIDKLKKIYKIASDNENYCNHFTAILKDVEFIFNKIDKKFNRDIVIIFISYL